LRHAGIYLLARGLPGVMAFLAIPLFSRLLTPDAYGRYALVIAAVNLLGALLFQWARLALVRFLPAYRDEPMRLKNTLLGSTATLALLLGACFVVAALLPIDPGWRPVLLACWIVLVIHAAYELSCEYARAALRPWRYMLLQMFRSGVGLGVGLLLVWGGWGWYGPLLGLASGMSIGVLYSYRTDWRGARARIDRGTLVKLLGYGVPVSLTVAMVSLMATCDRFLIALLMSEEAAGQYAVAVDLAAQTVGLLMLIVYMPLFPLAVHAWEKHGRAAAQEQMRGNAALQLGIGIPTMAGIIVLTPGIVHCLVGESFRIPAVQLVPLAAVAAFLAGMKAFHFDAAFQFANKTLYQAAIIAVTAVVNVALNLFMIPRWGLLGAAVASIGSYGLALALSIGFGLRHVALPIPRGDAARVVLGAAVMSAALWPFRDAISPLALAVQIVTGAAIYGGVLFASDFMSVRGPLLARVGLGPARARTHAGTSAAPEQVGAAVLLETHSG
jgi:O-antigen/teichoic acid export membrane protein